MGEVGREAKGFASRGKDGYKKGRAEMSATWLVRKDREKEFVRILKGIQVDRRR